jgi:hypothetical protein
MRAEIGSVRLRRAVIRFIAAAALVGLGFLMHRIGREFDVLIDNGTVVIDGEKIYGMEYGNVTVDSAARGAFDMWAGDRAIKKMVGAKHKLTIKILNEDDDSVIKTVERDITLDFDTKAEMVSISAIIGGAEDILTPNPLYSPTPVFVPEEDPAETGTGAPGEDEAGMEP